VIAESSGFSWEAVTAVGTFALAGATAILALSTRRVARATQDEVRTQWRPVLIPAFDSETDPAVGYNRDARLLVVRIRNGGRGPALYIRTHLDPGGISPRNWSLGSLAAGEEITLSFDGVYDLGSNAQVLLDYRDLAERTYSSALVLTEVAGVWRFYDVHVFDGTTVTALGDAVYPQTGLRDVRPRPKPTFIERIRASVASFRNQ